MTVLRPYKFLVAPVMQQVDEDGTVIQEIQPREPDVVFGVEALLRYAEGFDAALEQHLAQMQNGAIDVAGRQG